MDARKRSASIGAVLVAALAIPVVPASAATTTTRWVDGDGHAGPNGCNSSASAFKKIQTAVNASNEDDTVIVCPGTYRQQVRIRGDRDGLTLKSSTPFGATLLTPSSPNEVDEGVFVVSVEQVDRVTVRGFKVRARTDGPCVDLDVGILVIGSRRAEIRGNRVQAPGAGSPGACEMGVGIAVVDGEFGGGSPRSANAFVGFNEVRDASFGGIIAFGLSRMVTMHVIHNSVRAYFGEGPQTSAIEGILSGGQIGVGLLGRIQGEVSGNVIQGAPSGPLDGPAWLYGMAVGDEFVMASGDNGPIDIHDNIVRRVGYGMFISGVDQTTVRRNQVTNTYVGVYLVESTDSAIRRNSISAREGGIGLQGSSDNDVVSNTVFGSGGACFDDSSGGGTAGTDNHWADNTATAGSNPLGICLPPEV